jgi:hypothetical protein
LKGCHGESDDFGSLARWHFNHNFIAKKISRNKNLSAKRATQSSTAVIMIAQLLTSAQLDQFSWDTKHI